MISGRIQYGNTNNLKKKWFFLLFDHDVLASFSPITRKLFTKKRKPISGCTYFQVYILPVYIFPVYKFPGVQISAQLPYFVANLNIKDFLFISSIA